MSFFLMSTAVELGLGVKEPDLDLDIYGSTYIYIYIKHTLRSSMSIFLMSTALESGSEEAPAEEGLGGCFFFVDSGAAPYL